MKRKSIKSSGKLLLRKSIQPYLDTDISKYISHVFISIIIGLLAGGGAIVFHHVLYITRTFFRPDNFRAKYDIPVFFIVLIPVTGAILTSLLTWLYPSIAKEKGVISVIKAIIIRKGFIPLKETLFHFIAPIISIGTGAPLGPEGPSAKIGSGIGSYMSQLFRHKSNDVIMYTAAGGGAAISAVFNAPIAGVFFGIEVILLNDLKNRALSALIIAAVMADILSRTVLGNHKIFVIPSYSIGDLYTYPYYILLGVLCGIISIIYLNFSEFFKMLFNEKFKIHNPFLKLLPVALVFGFFLVYQYDLFGIGYIAINKVLQGQILPIQVLQLLILKVIFLALFLQAGAFGGSFAPALSIGTFLGYLMAVTSNMVFNTTLDPVAFALVGMGGVLAGINSIPLTSILLVFEVTSDYNFILPLMLVAIISHLAILYHRKGNEYTLALLDENIDVTKKGDLDIFRKMTVGSILQKDMNVVDYTAPFKEVVSIIIDAKYGDVFVVNRNKKLVGVITLKDVRQTLLDNDLCDLLIAGDLVIEIPPVDENDPVSLAIEKIREFNVENIPVVKSAANREFIGIINHRDIIETYYKTLDDISMSEFLL
ncbi:MAG TPA: chloride channel protein [Spirochaetota bacterium]|nr:chloride channel protein [Spirochaetota bacterium]HPS88048.1 chloride channel protein [Spirochaetota bacterium]